MWLVMNRVTVSLIMLAEADDSIPSSPTKKAWPPTAETAIQSVYDRA
jgi:hypothetical protein